MYRVRRLASPSPFAPLRGDLHTLTSWTTTGGVPVVAVFAAFALRRAARAGRWATVLTLIAFVGPRPAPGART
ncbi:hypothetical protein [Nonomuraea sp. NEAU-A123]|uniref:hypothetical protein n=1 Tax=Nonomuraea sp. NEAU-A123 TaxID=2839649 RepID=UPI001BE3F777|nr:hypothetical protein [Nonomuraea sp. NEAU-A123]MBT2232538.1 hypothetical protein [Nonomuraea sp. NEAU-A123]